MYILKRVVLYLVGLMVLFQLGTGLWKEVREIRITQQYEINDRLSHVTGLFVVKNAVIDARLGSGESDYSVDTIRTEGNHEHHQNVHTTEKRKVILFPLTETTSNGVPIVHAWLAKTARDEQALQRIKEQIFQGSLWSDYEIVETAQSRAQEELHFQLVPLRGLRRTLQTLARSKQYKERIKNIISAAEVARSRICRQGIKDDLKCPYSAPILFQGRRHGRFLGLGIHMWIASFLSFLAIGFLIGRTK